jgi:hypothetical protein
LRKRNRRPLLRGLRQRFIGDRSPDPAVAFLEGVNGFKIKDARCQRASALAKASLRPARLR